MNIAIILALINRILSWPVVALVLGLVFRRQLAAFWERIEALTFRHGETSVIATVGSASVQVIAVKASETTAGELVPTNIVDSAPALLPAPPLPAEIQKSRQSALDFGKNMPGVEPREILIRQQLVSLNFSTGDADTVEVLVRNLAFTQWTAASERIYRLIFGSQITLLIQLHIGVLREAAEYRRLYEKAVLEFPGFYGGYSYEQWIGFLQNQNLIQPVGIIGRFEITQAGRDFLYWMTTEGVIATKPG